MCKNCDTCKNILYDGSTGTYDCRKWDKLSIDDIECFVATIPGCSQWEEDIDYEAEDAYFDSLGAFKEG